MKREWRSLGVSAGELRCSLTLCNGQSFGWVHTGEAQWTGVLGRSVVSFRETPSDTLFCVNVGEEEEADRKVRDYLNLDHTIEALYKSWAEKDIQFRRLGPMFPGIRLLRQNPLECTFSFICSSNNNIKRIKQMLHKLRTKYGQPLGQVFGIDFYTFPTLETLAAIKEQELRALGFGYRAKFIVKSAHTILSLGAGFGAGQQQQWLNQLRETDMNTAKQELLQLTGVGPKVADCIALFSLDKLDRVPIDTHVWQLSLRYYGAEMRRLGIKTTTAPNAKSYNLLNTLFRKRFGDLAGWAHTIMFTAELADFQNRLK